MVPNDDLEGQTTHFTSFYTHTISGPKISKPTIVNALKPNNNTGSNWPGVLSRLVPWN